MNPQDLDRLIAAALAEDMPGGDVTSESVVPIGARSEAVLLAKEDGVLAGLEAARRVFAAIDPAVEFEALSEDGRPFAAGDVLARLRGPSVALLGGERTALNFLQRLCGIATTTRRYVDAVAGTKTRILDTRKTTPGLRALEKAAVAAGGGVNHRMSLSDMVLIKDNHLRLVGSVAEAVRRARERAPAGLRVEVEANSAAQAREALAAGADMIMLDNMPPAEMKDVIAMIDGRVPVEVSGKMTPEGAAAAAAIGADFVSVGALTHSYRSIDLSLEFDEGRG